MKNKDFWVYILTNKKNTVFYIGLSNNVENRYYQHISVKNRKSFSAKYNLNKIVYMEYYTYIEDAIVREKQLKKWRRKWKIALIKKENPFFLNLMKSVFPESTSERQFKS